MFNAQSRLLCMADLKVFTPRLVYCTAMSAKSDMLLDLDSWSALLLSSSQVSVPGNDFIQSLCINHVARAAGNQEAS